MRFSSTHAIVLSCLAAAAVVSTGCQEDETNDTSSSTSTSTSTTSSSSSTSGGGTGGTTSSGTGGAGGEGAGSTGGSGGTGGVGPDACLTSETTHLFINEIAVGGIPAEFIEIRNPGSNPVDLSHYYLSDNSSYYGIAAGDPWNPPANDPGTDFLIGFPPGTAIAAGGLLTIEFGTDFETSWNTCPDFTVRAGVTCGGNSIPQMVAPTNGGLGDSPGYMLSGGGEMAMLFCWTPGYLVHDVDYVHWDADSDPNTHVDKTNVTGYQPDTSMANQVNATIPDNWESMGRCDDDEDSETTTGGNGLLGHDETSEDWNTSFPVQAAPTPGAANNCN